MDTKGKNLDFKSIYNIFSNLNSSKEKNYNQGLNYKFSSDTVFDQYLFNVLMDNSPDAIYFKDLESRLIKVNTGFIKKIGVSSENEVLGKTDFDIFDADHAADARKDEVFIIRNSEPVINKVEKEILPSGEIVWVSTTKLPLKNTEGEIIGTFGISRDITGVKQIHEKLESSEEKLRHLISSTSAVIYHLHFLGKSFVLRWVGENIILFGYTTEESLHPDWWSNIVHPDDLEYVNSIRNSLLENKMIAEYRIKHKDGYYIWVRDEMVPVRDSKSNYLEIFGSWIDISERMKVEEALLASETQLSNALKISHLCHWEYDVENDLFNFNDQFYSVLRTTAKAEGGYMMSSSRYAQRFVHPDDINMVGVEIQKAMETNDPKFSGEFEHRIIYADGQTGYITIKYFVVKNSEGKTIRTYGVNQDITERKKVEKALVDSELKLSNSLKMAKLCHWEMDVINDLLIFNDQFYSIFRTSVKEQGSYSMSSAQYLQRFVQPADTGLIYKEIQKAIETKDPNYSNQFENRVIFSDGEIGYVAVRFYIEKDDSGKTVKAFGIVQDITESKKAEEALRASEYFLRKSQSVARVGSYKFDINRGTWESSQTLDEILGIDENYPKNIKGIFRLVRPSHLHEIIEYMRYEVIAKRNRFEKECIIIKQNNKQEHWIQVIGDLECDKEGNPDILIGTIQDISEQIFRDLEKHHLEKKLRDRNKELENMLFDLKRMQVH